MITVEEIKTAIDSLPDKEYLSLRNWFSERDWKNGTERLKKIRKPENWTFLLKKP